MREQALDEQLIEATEGEESEEDLLDPQNIAARHERAAVTFGRKIRTAQISKDMGTELIHNSGEDSGTIHQMQHNAFLNLHPRTSQDSMNKKSIESHSNTHSSDF